jgi:hypothetical protein
MSVDLLLLAQSFESSHRRWQNWDKELLESGFGKREMAGMLDLENVGHPWRWLMASIYLEFAKRKTLNSWREGKTELPNLGLQTRTWSELKLCR